MGNSQKRNPCDQSLQGDVLNLTGDNRNANYIAKVRKKTLLPYYIVKIN